jgi:hypothetical protein
MTVQAAAAAGRGLLPRLLVNAGARPQQPPTGSFLPSPPNPHASSSSPASRTLLRAHDQHAGVRQQHGSRMVEALDRAGRHQLEAGAGRRVGVVQPGLGWGVWQKPRRIGGQEDGATVTWVPLIGQPYTARAVTLCFEVGVSPHLIVAIHNLCIVTMRRTPPPGTQGPPGMRGRAPGCRRRGRRRWSCRTWRR